MSNDPKKVPEPGREHDESPPQSPFDRPIAIHVTDSSLMGLVVAGMESYHVRHWGNGVGKGAAETAGLLWGYVVSKADMDHIVVDYVSTDTFAKGTAGEVGLNDDVTEVKRRVIAYRWPYLTNGGRLPYPPLQERRRSDEEQGMGVLRWRSELEHLCFLVGERDPERTFSRHVCSRMHFPGNRIRRSFRLSIIRYRNYDDGYLAWRTSIPHVTNPTT